MEQEIKLTVLDRQAAEKIFADSYLSPHLSKREKIYMHTQYYDTRNGDFSRNKYTLRLRYENERSVVCFKAPTADPHARLELECTADNIKDGIKQLKENPALPDAAKELLSRHVFPYCGADFTRSIAVFDSEGLRYELCYDCGILSAGKNTEPVSELELELKSGSFESMAAASEYLCDTYGLTPLATSKLQRARALTASALPWELKFPLLKKFIGSLSCLVAGALIFLLCNLIPPVSVFFREAALWFTSIIGKISHIFSFPLSEFFIVLLPILLAWRIIYALIHPEFSFLNSKFLKNGTEFDPKKPKSSGAGRVCAIVFSQIFMFVSGLFLAFVLLHGVHYTAPPLAQELNLKLTASSAEELKGATQKLMLMMNKYAVAVPRDEAGNLDFGDFNDIATTVMDNYTVLGKEVPFYNNKGLTPKKSLFLTKPMSYVGVAGYYFPFTGEPIVNKGGVDSHIPFDIAHEAAHSKGVGSEAAANFTAFLACTATDDPQLRYSAAFNAFIYANNAFYAISPNEASAISAQLCAEARLDIAAFSAYLAKYETPVRDVGNSINDAYIKATGQPSGVQSYGEMVDLLLAYIRQNPDALDNLIA